MHMGMSSKQLEERAGMLKIFQIIRHISAASPPPRTSPLSGLKGYHGYWSSPAPWIRTHALDAD